VLSLAIKNARVVTPVGVIEGAVGVEGERIAYVGGEAGVPSAERVIDGGGNYLIPGFINAHVHLSGWRPGPPRETLSYTFPVQGRAALMGGITTWGVFITAAPDGTLGSAAEAYREMGAAHSLVDFYLHGIVTSEVHLAELPELAHRHGITSVKHFYNANKPRPGEPEPSGSIVGVESDFLYRSLERLATLGPNMLGMVHCEDQDLIWLLEDRLKAQRRHDLAAWAEARPGWVEALRMRMAFEIARAVKAPLYCVHIACSEGVDIMAEARSIGYPYWGETGPHYLSHTADMETQIGSWGRVNTSIKWEHDRLRLWQGIREGSITNMGTDGVGFPRAAKENGGGKHGNIWNARSTPGPMRHWLPVMMSLGVNDDRLSIEQVVQVCCTNNARVFGLYPQKGVLQEGADADLVLVDPDVVKTVDEAYYHGAADWSIYYGWKLKGDARLTVIRGKVMMEEGALKGEPGWGQYMPRSPE